MSQNLTISETGLKLIKAFEGYRPVDRELITGQRVVGYGHRLYSDDAVIMDKGEAEKVLRADLEPFEDMINSEVHAPMTQSQFDALCSFAFNIGPKAFLQSDTLRAINNGRPLDAANGLDIWRKSEIDGKIYVVDALMRRRTAEKALFLRTERSVSAGRENLRPIQDMTLADLSTEDGLPIFTESDASGIVATAPYEATIAPARRREDGLAGALQLSERDIIDTDEMDESNVVTVDVAEDEAPLTDFEASELTSAEIEDLIEAETLDEVAQDAEADLETDIELLLEDDQALEDKTPRKSPIAAAATDIVARLDALIDDTDTRFDEADEDWPESMLDAEQDEAESSEENLIELNKGDTLASRIMNERITRDEDNVSTELSSQSENSKPIAVIDELAQDDAVRMRTDSAAKYIETTQPVNLESELDKKSDLGLWIPILLGFIMVGLAGGSMMSGSEHLLGQWGAIIVFTSFVIGLGLILAAVYAALRMNLSR